MVIIKSCLNVTGIEDNYLERLRFKRSLEEKQNTEVVVAPLGIQENSTIAQTRHFDVAQPNEQPLEQPMNGPVEPLPTPKPHVARSEEIRKILVNNYRPVQPLNGRVVYRSFPFFDEPINSDVEVIYIEKIVGDESSASITCVSLFTLLCSILLSAWF